MKLDSTAVESRKQGQPIGLKLSNAADGSFKQLLELRLEKLSVVGKELFASETTLRSFSKLSP